MKRILLETSRLWDIQSAFVPVFTDGIIFDGSNVTREEMTNHTVILNELGLARCHIKPGGIRMEDPLNSSLKVRGIVKSFVRIRLHRSNLETVPDTREPPRYSQSLTLGAFSLRLRHRNSLGGHSLRRSKTRTIHNLARYYVELSMAYHPIRYFLEALWLKTEQMDLRNCNTTLKTQRKNGLVGRKKDRLWRISNIRSIFIWYSGRETSVIRNEKNLDILKIKVARRN